MTDITEIKRELEALTAKVAAYEAEKAKPARNWPEKIEPGMAFQSPATTATWMATDVDGLFVCLKGETGSFKAAGRTMRLNREGIPHAGHARDILTVRTDAHEPTGAELVGKVCEFSDDGVKWFGRNECAMFDADDTVMRYRSDAMLGDSGVGAMWFRFARLAR